jgi:deazaflavin-dependent oxidoreductase (nitroreductase family)
VGRIWHSLVRRTGWLVVPLAGRRFLPIWLVIRHVGRTSGRTYATPVAGHRTRDGFVIPMPFGPHTQWAKNILAAGSAEMTASGHRYALDQPRLLEGAEALGQFNRLERVILRAFGTRNVLAVRTIDRLD